MTGLGTQSQNVYLLCMAGRRSCVENNLVLTKSSFQAALQKQVPELQIV